MSENMAQTLQKVIQDLVAPDVRELKTIVVDLQKQMDQRFDAMDHKFTARFDAMDQKFTARLDASDEKFTSRFDAMDQKAVLRDEKADAQFRALMAAFGEFRAQSELVTIRVVSQLSERVAMLEAQRQ